MTTATLSNVKQHVYNSEFVIREALDRARSGVHRYDFHGSILHLEGDRVFSELSHVQSYVDAVLALNWVRETWPRRSVQSIRVRQRRGHAKAHYEHGGVMAVPARENGRTWAMRELVILHEIAHHLALGDGHGPRFCATLAMLVENVISAEAAMLLRHEYLINGVHVGEVSDGCR